MNGLADNKIPDYTYQQNQHNREIDPAVFGQPSFFPSQFFLLQMVVQLLVKLVDIGLKPTFIFDIFQAFNCIMHKIIPGN